MTESTQVDTAAAEATRLAIKAKFDNKVDVKETSFHFKKVAIKTEDGKDTGEFSKRPTVTLNLPVPSIEGIVSILENGGKGLELLQEAVAGIVESRVRELLADNESLTEDTFDLAQLGWDVIANLPKAERRGGGISKETWEEFCKDYIAVMPGVTGKTVEQVSNAAKIFSVKFNGPVKSNKKVLEVLLSQLALYATNSPKAEEYADCVQFLTQKGETLLQVDEAALLQNL